MDGYVRIGFFLTLMEHIATNFTRNDEGSLRAFLLIECSDGRKREGKKGMRWTASRKGEDNSPGMNRWVHGQGYLLHVPSLPSFVQLRIELGVLFVCVYIRLCFFHYLVNHKNKVLFSTIDGRRIDTDQWISNACSIHPRTYPLFVIVTHRRRNC